MALTDIRIKTAKPKDKPYKLADSDWLFILVQPSGSKLWRLGYRYAGKQKLLALGSYPAVSLAQAREKRDQARKLLESGIDPAGEMSKRAKKQREMTQVESAFEGVAREWYENQRGKWSASHADRVLSSLETDVFPDLGKIPLQNITAPMVLAVLRKVERRDALELAARILQRCSSVFRYAIQTGRIEQNPCTELKGALKTRKVEHRAALSRAELPAFLDALAAYDGNVITKLAMKLVLLTFVRTGELRGARWDEFDLDRAQWVIPAERMKMRNEHIVPLSTQALAVIEELKPHTSRSELLFPSERQLTKPISENTMLYALYRLGYHGRATIHGFRATASTILNESGFKSDAIERQLAHTQQNKVRAAYHRSEYLEERATMMQWWADFLEGLTANVIPIRRGMQE